MKLSFSKKSLIIVSTVLVFGIGYYSLMPNSPAPVKQAVDKVALTVTAVQPTTAEWPIRIPAYGNIVAWQEASVGSELGSLLVESVLVDVGDQVSKGQILATFNSDMLDASVAEQRASVEVAKATLSEAQANAERARQLRVNNALSEQQVKQQLTAEKTAQARLQAELAKLESTQIRQKQTLLRSPDSGVISLRTATVGSVASPGAELFRLVRQNKLEWRAEVTPENIGYIEPGQGVTILLPNKLSIAGQVRVVAPTVDSTSRTGLIYIDLPHNRFAKSGMFTAGEIDVGIAQGLTIPETAVVYREGLSFVFIVNKDNRAVQTEITIGRHHAKRYEIKQGVTLSDWIVETGAGFLSDGDTVYVSEDERNKTVSVR
ncbi:efflux RND transporter periplasmic adaptor subunit [Teredinibacter purpureus]|uniref:efflux RND transporter periplasmic adaptor subunit n=1 Tax=Teredinibacter purpureus TaxID=2731756 RepID=UPI0005F79C5D|nr:efflux RND transporter periplasmic adaptor subunit [Teredinibacter purpureus]